MRKRFLSLLLTLCMVLGLMPVVAQPVTVEAAESSHVTEVYIGGKNTTGGKKLDQNTPYYHNGENGNLGMVDDNSTDANATFDANTGTLTLNNLNIITDQPGIWWEHRYNGAHDLTIVLNNDTTNTISNTTGSGIVGAIGIPGAGPSLTVTGSGILNVTGQTCGIWVWENITICDSVTVNATGSAITGICNNDSSGKITIKDQAKVTANGATYGIGYDYSNYNVPVIQGGTVTLTGGTAAVRVKAGYDRNSPDLASYPSDCKVTVGDTVDNATEWKTSNLLQNYKYIKIEQGSHVHDYAWKTNADQHWQECEGYRCNASTIVRVCALF